MTQSPQVSMLFLDIGGVLLTNGWDRYMRRDAAEEFELDHDEMDERHHLIFDTYEEGKLSLDEYLDRVIFYEERAFSKADFQEYMFSRSEPHEEMLEFMRLLGRRPDLRIGAISNEGRELTEFRIEKFGLTEFMDFFVCSCFVHFRKPDKDIYRIALDVAQVPAEESVYIEDRPLLVRVAGDLGIRGIVHEDYPSTRAALEELGIST